MILKEHKQNQENVDKNENLPSQVSQTYNYSKIIQFQHRNRQTD